MIRISPSAIDLSSPNSSGLLPPITLRNCREKTKERKKHVWSPLLDNALIEALGKCQRRDARRFPKRNQYISDYIFSATGSRRTPKQVGSRLQQLSKDNTRVLALLSPPTALADVVVSASAAALLADPPKTVVTIELVPPSSQQQGSMFRQPNSNQRHIYMEYPSEIENSNPVVTFSSPHQICTTRHYSYFRVFVDDQLVHSEITNLTLGLPVQSLPRTGRYTYGTNLIPHFWSQLCRTKQLFGCVIQQDILIARAPFNDLPTSVGAHDQPIRSILYDFLIELPLFYPPALAAEPAIPPEFLSTTGYRTSFSSRTSGWQEVKEQSPSVYGWDVGPSVVASPVETIPAPQVSTSESSQGPYVASAWSDTPMYSELRAYAESNQLWI